MRTGKTGATIGICPALLGCLTFGAVVQACTRVSDVDRFPVRDEVLRIEQTVPAQGDDDVDVNARVDLCLSAFVDPRSIRAPDVYFASGEARYDVEVSLELSPWTAPAGAPLGPGTDRPWCEGSVLAMAPEIPLEPGLSFRLRLTPFLRGWDGEELDREQQGWVPEAGSVRYYLEFTTAPAAGTESGTDSGLGAESGSESGSSGSESGSESGGEPEPIGVTLADLFAAGGPFDPARSLCSCHRGDDELAHELLDLTDPSTAYADLVLDTRERDTGFPMVSPRLPSESFLVHKLLRQHGERLRGVLGEAMPPDEPLPYADYVAIALWIEAGALP